MKFAFTTLLLLLSSVVALADEEFRAFNIVPLPRGNEKQIAADCVEYVRRTGNRVCLCSMTLHPEGKPAMAKPRRNFETYRRLKEELKGTDVRLGILIQSIMGHWPRVDRDVEPWMRTVNIDGDAVRFCPLDPGFADYIRTIGKMCAAERPAFILGDDDIRASVPTAECFCERHRKLFCERMGREFSAEQFRAVVRGSKGGEKAHEVFVGLQLEMVDRICRLLREGIDSVDPSIPAGTCMDWNLGRRYNDRAAKAIAAKGQRPVMRLCSANYFEMRLDDYPANVLKTLALAAQFKDTTDLLDESDTCPHNYWSKTSVGLHAHLVTAMFAGLKGAKLWYVGMHKGTYPVNPGYLDTLAANRGFYATLFRELEGSSFLGLAAPCQARLPADPFPAYRAAAHWGDSFITHLAGQFGVPFWATFDLDAKDAVYSLSDAREVAIFDDAELKRILSGHVLVDGSGAVELAKRGFADLIGCEATPAAKGFNAERLTATGGRIALMPAAKPALLKAKPGTGILSELGYVPFAGSPDFDVVAPGATVCTNRLGGTVVVTAYPHDCVAWYKHNEARKDWFVACLDAANGAPLPFVCGNAQPVLTLAKRLTDGSHLVAVYNLCFEGMRETSLRLPASVAKVELLGADGVWRPQTFRRGANGYAAFDVALPCYGVAVFKVR